MKTKIKGKLDVWVAAFVIALIVTNIGKIGSCIGGAFDEKRESISVSMFTEESSIVDNVSSLGNNFSTYDDEGYIVNYSLNDTTANVIISDRDLKGELGDTHIYLGNATSPIVMVAGEWLTETNAFFNVIEQTVPGYSSNYKTFSCDFEDVITALLEDKSWEDLGVSKKIIKGKLSLVVPKMNTIEGEFVWNYIYTTIENMYPEKADSDIVNMTNTVVDKARQSNSIIMEFNDYYSHTTKSEYANSVWLIPEHMIASAKDTFDIDNTSQLYPIYLNKTNAIGYYVYAVNDETFLTKFKEYAQEVIMEPLTIRYGTDNISGLCDDYRHFKSIINSKTVFYEDLGEVGYTKTVSQAETTTTPTVESVEEVNKEPVETEEVIEENLQGEADVSGEVSVSSSNNEEVTTSTTEDDNANVEEDETSEVETSESEEVSEDSEENEENTSDESESSETEEDDELDGIDIFLMVLLAILILMVVIPLFIFLFDIY